MGEHLVVNMDQLPRPEAVGPSPPVPQAAACGPAEKKPELVDSSSSSSVPEDDKMVLVVVDDNEEAPLIGMGECRICQEEDSLNNLESPCACSGSLKVSFL